MTISLAQRLLAAGAVCLLALIGLVVMEGRARAAGKEIILRMQPVDPRALLTGHYVQLSFADTLEPGEACPPPIAEPPASPVFERERRDHWLVLRKDGDVHVLVGGYATRPKSLPYGEVVVRGTARCEPPFTPEPGGDGATTPATVFLDLSVDRFFADQDEAEALEKILRDRDNVDRTAAILSVSEDGTVRTKGILIDGKRVELTWF